MACRALIVACCVVFMATVVLGGCSKARETATGLRNAGEAAKLAQGETARIQTENGVVEVQAQKQGEDQVTIKTTGPDGKEVTYQGGKQADLSKLGIEIYPGAKQEQKSPRRSSPPLTPSGKWPSSTRTSTKTGPYPR